MSFGSCAICWDNPCTCPGSAWDIVRVLRVLETWALDGVSVSLLCEHSASWYVQLGAEGPIYAGATAHEARAKAAAAIKAGEV